MLTISGGFDWPTLVPWFRLRIKRESMLPGIPDFKGQSQILWTKSQILWMKSQILWMKFQIVWKTSIHFNVVHRKVHWRNPQLKSSNLMPAICVQDLILGGHISGRSRCNLHGGIYNIFLLIISSQWSQTTRKHCNIHLGFRFQDFNLEFCHVLFLLPSVKSSEYFHKIWDSISHLRFTNRRKTLIFTA